MKEQKFLVIKTNNVGRQQRRILVIDQQRQEIRSFDEKMRLHVDGLVFLLYRNAKVLFQTWSRNH